MAVLPLVFDAPRAALPPPPPRRSRPGRAAGGGRGRGDCRPSGPTSCSRHYFDRLRERPGGDDRPAGRRPRAGCADALLPRAAHRGAAAVRPTADAPARRCGGCTTARSVESVLMRYPGPAAHRVRLQPGRLRHGLPVLRDRPGRPDPQPVHRRDRRAGRSPPRAHGRAASCPAARAGCPTWCSWAWASRWPTTRGCVAALHRLIDPGAGRARAVAALGHRLDRRPGAGDRPARRRGARRHARGLAARARTTSCATPWCR